REGTRRQAPADRHAGRLLHHLEPRRHRRHRVHADHQRAGSSDPRCIARGHATGVPRPHFRPAPDAAGVSLLRPSRDRWCDGGALHHLARPGTGRTPQSPRGRAVSVDLTVPDLGNFTDVDVVDVLVKPGDDIEVDAPLVTLETDKASMDVPATSAGRITEVVLKRGDKVSKGSLIARVEAGTGAAAPAQAPAAPAATAAPQADASARAPRASVRADAVGDTVRMPSPLARPPEEGAGDAARSTQLLVLGAGPGGYTAAVRAADLGLKVTLVERHSALGGVCLNVGCIPSKALLHAAKVIEDAEEMATRGIAFGEPKIDRARLRDWKASVVAKLTGGLTVLAKQRKVEVMRGVGRFVG